MNSKMINKQTGKKKALYKPVTEFSCINQFMQGKDREKVISYREVKKAESFIQIHN